MKPKLILHPRYCPPSTQKARDAGKEEFERSVAQAFPNEPWLAKSLADKFYADIYAHPDSPGEQVWHYGPVLVRYRIRPGAQQVEILSVTRHEKPSA